MSVHNMRFVLVNDMAPRVTSVCAACSRSLNRAICMTVPPRAAIAGSSATPNGGDEWIHLVVRFSEPIRTRHRLAEADC